MEKLKNIINPGHATDDQQMYDVDSQIPQTGAVSGEGSHLQGSLQPARPAEATGHDRDGALSGNLSRPETLDRDASTASIKSGIQGYTSRSGLTGSSTSAAPLAGDRNKELPVPPDTAGSSGLTDTTGTGRNTGTSHTGADRSFPLSGGAAGGQGYQSSALPNRAAPSVDSDASRGLSGGHQAGMAASSLLPGHEYEGQGQQYKNTLGEGVAYPPSTSGPHITETANRLDPHVSPTGGASQGLVGGVGSTAAASSGVHRSSQNTGPSDAIYEGTQQYTGKRAGSTVEDPASKTIGPHESNILNVFDPRVKPDPSKMKSHRAESTPEDPASKTAGPHSSNVANVVDPTVLPQPSKQKAHTEDDCVVEKAYSSRGIDPQVSSTTSNSRTNRSADLAGGAGAVGVGDYAPGREQGNLGTNVQEPTRGGPSKPTVGPSQLSPGNKLSEQNYGRDVGLTGGVGGATLGAYEAGKNHGNLDPIQRSTQQSAGTNAPQSTTGQVGPTEQDPKHSYGRDAGLAGGAGAVGLGGYEVIKHHETDKSVDPTLRSAQQTGGAYGGQSATGQTDSTQQDSKRLDGRDAGFAGGTAVAGLGAYEAGKLQGGDKTTDSYQRSTEQPGGAYGSQTGTKGLHDPPEGYSKHHYGRDATVAGGAGVAGAGAAHEYSKHDTEKTQKAQEKAMAQHTKETQKAEKKNITEQEKESKKEKGGVLGGLRHMKDKIVEKLDDGSSQSQVKQGNTSHDKEEALAGGPARTTVGAYGAENVDHNQLHKDPPAGYGEKRSDASAGLDDVVGGGK